jgi:hypothetical protein
VSNTDKIVKNILPYLKSSDPTEDFAVDECRKALKQALLSGVLVPQKEVLILKKRLEMAEHDNSPICSGDAGKGWEKKFPCWVCEMDRLKAKLEAIALRLFDGVKLTGKADLNPTLNRWKKRRKHE